MTWIDFIQNATPIPPWFAIVAYLIGCALGIMTGIDHQKQIQRRNDREPFLNYLAEHPDLCKFLGTQRCGFWGDISNSKCHKITHEECQHYFDIFEPCQDCVHISDPKHEINCFIEQDKGHFGEDCAHFKKEIEK